jgi:hypothetical protein
MNRGAWPSLEARRKSDRVEPKREACGKRNFVGFCCVHQRVGCFILCSVGNPVRHHSRAAARSINGSARRAGNARRLCCPSARMWKLWRAGAVTESIAWEHSGGYIWGKEAKHDRFSGSLALRAVRRGHLLYHPSPWYEAGYLRNRALDLVGLHARNVGHNYRGQPDLTTSDPSKLVGFSPFAAALLVIAQLTTNFGLPGRASPVPRLFRIWAGTTRSRLEARDRERAISSCLCSAPGAKGHLRNAGGESEAGLRLN